MLRLLSNYIKENALFTTQDNLLIAVSGGIDSVFLLDRISLLGYSFGIAHCQFNLRGRESAEDAMFVEQLAKSYKAKFYLKEFNTQDYAIENSISIQMAARVLRYNWFMDIARKWKYNYILTAHHLDDAIETYFINQFRGCGIAGLHGMKPKEGNLVRPLLFAARKEIEAAAKQSNLKYREDKSNAELKYQRNFIRHRILPEVEKIFPAYRHSVNQNMLRFSEAEKIIDEKVKAFTDKIIQKEQYICIPIKLFEEFKPPQLFLYYFLSEYGFNETVIREIAKAIHGISGKEFFSVTHRVIKNREELQVHPGIKNGDDIFEIADAGRLNNLPVHLEMSYIDWKADKKIPADPNIAYLDAAKLRFPLYLRRWRTGDCFYPLGMEQKKKLSDFFVDNKLSLVEKEKIWLLCSRNDIVWIAGLRIDHRYRIRKSTKKVIIINYKPL